MIYEVIRRVTLEQRYVVSANDPKEADAKTCDIEPVGEAEVSSETMSIQPARRSAQGKSEKP